MGSVKPLITRQRGQVQHLKRRCLEKGFSLPVWPTEVQLIQLAQANRAKGSNVQAVSVFKP